MNNFAIREDDYRIIEFDGPYLQVEVMGMGVVQIKAEDKGIVVDIFTFQNSEKSVASTWAHINDLIEDE